MAKQRSLGGTSVLEEPKPLQVQPKRKSIFDTINDFYEAIINHPDAKILGADFETRPGNHECFLDVTREGQRIITLRFLAKWPVRG